MILWEVCTTPPTILYQNDNSRWQILRSGCLIGSYTLSTEVFDPQLPGQPVVTVTGDTAGTLPAWLRFIPAQLGITQLRILPCPAYPDGATLATRLTQPQLPSADGSLCLCCTRRDAPDVTRGFTACDYFDLYVHNTRIGCCSLRAGYHPSLWVSGHIGYTVFPPYRGKHYAAQAVRLLLRHARAWGMPQVSICCVPENTASRRTCECAGLRFDGIHDIPVQHALYARGKRQFCRYVVNP